MPDFSNRDPLAPAFWDERFDKQFTPWDRGAAPAALRAFVAQASKPLTTLVPGCGSAWELALMLDAGWDATAIDFSPSAVARAKGLAGRHAGHIVQADFFDYLPSKPLDLVYEQAFLCALPRARWPEVAARWAQLLAPGGLLAGYFFFDDLPKGPPFGIARDRLDALLAPYFECIADDAVNDSIPVFAAKERWMVWRRRP
ncbi:methyltransferase domain-containing protein [Massilia aerilata]|uniref:Methyltransferase domain-containing protein n=1 Tax=Massilia aerilata TaxID=453817 RepID=A0ABW0S2B3_9BURK